MKEQIGKGVCGIYAIHHLSQDKYYIGQSVDIKRRWQQECNNADNLLIGRTIWKYGENDFDFIVLERCSKPDLNKREAYWSQYYNSMVPNGYNEFPPGTSYTVAYDGKPVSCYDALGNYVNTFACARVAEDQLDINASNIRRACVMLQRTAGGFYWRFGEDTQQIQIVKSDPEMTKQKIATKLGRPVEQLDLKTGEVLATFPSGIEASRALGHPSDKGTNIGRVCNGIRGSAFGYGWRWKQ